MRQRLSIGGFTPFSTVDYPGALAAVVFCQGCPWSCPYCHNAHLQAPGPGLAWESLLPELERRRSLLDAVVFSGGEPLVQPGLYRAMEEGKALGLRIGLHTGGCDPEHLAQVLPLVDWVGLDLKGPRAAYARITGDPGSARAVWTCLAQLQTSGCAFELRTTWDPECLSEQDLQALALELTEVSPSAWILQAARHPGRPLPILSQALQASLKDQFSGCAFTRDQAWESRAS